MKTIEIYEALRTALAPGRWQRQLRVHFAVNVAVGVLIAVVFHFAEESSVGKKVIGAMVDHIVRAEFKGAEESKIPTDLAFIDINDKDFFFEPSLFTNRALIANLLRSVIAARPQSIILDIDLTERSPQDDSLSQFFAEFVQDVASGRTDTKLIMPLIKPACQSDEPPQSVFHDLVADCPNVYFGLADVATDWEERSIRYILEYDIIGSKDTVWSMPIAAYAFSKGFRKSELSKSALESRLGLHVGDIDKETERSINIFTSRIRYLLKPNSGCSEGGSLDGNIDGGNALKMKIRYDAVLFADEDGHSHFGLPEKEQILKGKTVIIGNPSAAKHDIHLTPIGEMPGMYIIGNTFNTLKVGQVSHLGWYWKYLIELAVIVVCAYLFLHFKSLAAGFIGRILIIIPLYYLTVYVFESTGAIINVVFITLGISLHRFFTTIEEVFQAIKKREHKSFFMHNRHEEVK